MSGLIGKKVGMTSVFDEDGRNIPCTVIEAGPCVVTQLRTMAKDGYEAVQLAFGDKIEKRSNKAETGHFKKAKTSPKKRVVEFKTFNEELNLGDTLQVDIFTEGAWVDVTGISKGKGFQGVVKRHNFAGVNDATHGQHNRSRAPGSLGASSFPSRVFKGMKMAGRMGGDRVKVFNLKILKLIPDKNIILVKGAVPGSKGSYLIIEE